MFIQLTLSYANKHELYYCINIPDEGSDKNVKIFYIFRHEGIHRVILQIQACMQ